MMNSVKKVQDSTRSRTRQTLLQRPGTAGTALAALFLVVPVCLSAAGVTDGPALRSATETANPFSGADEFGRFVYLIEFAESGALHRDLRGKGERFDRSSSGTQGLLAEIKQEQAVHVAAMTQALGATPEVTHYFLVTHSGLAARLHPLEAEAISELPGVVLVEREQLYELTTYRGPTFIGADTIWDGSAVPGGVGTRGEGMVIGMLDTGVASAHPSFANDAACGHGVGMEPDKLISSLDCAQTDPDGLCNGPNPEDTHGHGTHTSSTSGGNTLNGTAVPPPSPPAPYTEISGVAPCAHIRSYRVCPTNFCPVANTQAGMESVLLHGDVDVMNYSIEGGYSPWVDTDRRKLDLVDADVLVATTAGNISVAIPNTVGQVKHRGPWVLTVAASTHDDASGSISASGPGTPPANTQDIAAVRGRDSPPGAELFDLPIKHFIGQADTEEGCNVASPPFPAGFFDGAAALIHRGSCSFLEQITNAFNAGANFVIVRNNVADRVIMPTPGQPVIPAYLIDQVPGNALVAFVDANPTNATMNFSPVGDVLGYFSQRGPTPAPLEDLTKPDITGPGIAIYAAIPGSYGYKTGTSMSSPHAAGAATLVRAVHPDWTVTEVKSALMMTAFTGGTKEDGRTSWDADDVGGGGIDLSKAALAGLVMDETTANFLAADPALGGDVKTLNLPAVRNTVCTPSCSWTRVVRNTLDVPTSWTAVGNAITPTGMLIDIQPASFDFTGSLAETQVLTITVTPQGDQTAAVAFGEVVLSEAGSLSPDQRITVGIKGMGPAPEIFADGFESGDTSAWTKSIP